MKKLLTLAVLAALILSFGTSAFACGGDGEHKDGDKEVHDEA